MKILIAVDSSKFSDAAVRMLISQNQPDKAIVRVLHVVAPLETSYYPELTPPYPMDFSDIKKYRMKAGRDLTARMAAKIRKAGFKVDTLVAQGPVKTTIVDHAAKWRPNLIVMGSHGRKTIERILLGSVSEYVVRHAPCSVQIVRTAKK